MIEPDWRTRHCADHAVDWLKQATGRDLWAELGIEPRSARAGAEVYRRLGVTNLKAAVGAVLGDQISPLQARRGDIAMVDNALGVVRGEWIECIDQMQPLSRAECAWRVEGR